MQDSALVSVSASEYVSWQRRDAPVTIRLRPQAMQGIYQEVMEGFNALPRRGVEVGGVLLGVRDGDRVTIEDFEPVLSEHRFGPSYLLSETDTQSLKETIDWFQSGARPQLAVVGFYRSHTRSEFSATGEDEKIFAEDLPEGADAFLLIKPLRQQTAVADFFFREDGRLRKGSSPLRFPFESRSELAFRTDALPTAEGTPGELTPVECDAKPAGSAVFAPPQQPPASEAAADSGQTQPPAASQIAPGSAEGMPASNPPQSAAAARGALDQTLHDTPVRRRWFWPALAAGEALHDAAVRWRWFWPAVAVALAVMGGALGYISADADRSRVESAPRTAQTSTESRQADRASRGLPSQGSSMGKPDKPSPLGKPLQRKNR